MSVLISMLGTPPKERRLPWGWVALFLAIWAALSISSILLNSSEGQNFPAVYLVVMSGVATVCLMIMAMGFILERPKPVEFTQQLELDGSKLTSMKPLPWVIDFTAANAYVLRFREGDPTYASIRFLRDEGDISIYCHTSEPQIRDLWVSGDAEPPPGAWCGVPDYRDKFGLALLHQVEKNKAKNRFWTELQQLSKIQLRHADDSAVVQLGDDDDDDALSYRSSGKPGPEEPGFGTWLSNYGLRVSSNVVLSEQHVVAQCSDGIRRAFPIGMLVLKREPGGLRVWAAGAAYSVPVEDAVLAEALVERLHSVEAT